MKGPAGRLPVVFLKFWFALAVIQLAACCETSSSPPEEYKEGPRSRLIHVVSNGWHTAIVIPAEAVVSAGVLPEAADFSGAGFFEFGWGDRTYYPAKEKTLKMAVSAALKPTPAVMHIAELRSPPREGASSLKVISVKLTEKGFQRLIGVIAAEFERPAGGGRAAAPVSRGLYLDSRFYNARGKFHLFNTCNTWTARMLHAAGVDVDPSGIITADDVMSRLQESG